jgi:hypothetical protein
MNVVNYGAAGVLLLFEIALPGATSHGRSDDNTGAELYNLRQRLAGLQAGICSDQVLKVLGKPDEVRPVPKGRLFDCVLFLGDGPGVGPETERWAYGITGHGKFARVGFVSIDRNNKVVTAIAADRFAEPGGKPPEQSRLSEVGPWQPPRS